MSHKTSAIPTGLYTRVQPWIQAARPLAHPMIFVPLFVGQAYAFYIGRNLSLVLFLYTLLFGLLYQVYLLYWNDAVDQAVDSLNTDYWLSGGSRVLVEGKLQREHLVSGARVALVGMLGLALFLAAFVERPWMLVAVPSVVALAWAYNNRPLQWSYRGHGEVLQGLGCGVLLPMIGFYMQQGSLQQFPWFALVPLYLIFYSGNIVTALPDYSADSAGGKNTFVVRHGERHARRTVLVFLALAYVCVVLVNRQLSIGSVAFVVLPSGLIHLYLGTVEAKSRHRENLPMGTKTFVTWTSISQAWVLCVWCAVLLVN